MMRYLFSFCLGFASRLPMRRESLAWFRYFSGLWFRSQVWKPPSTAPCRIRQQTPLTSYRGWVNLSISAEFPQKDFTLMLFSFALPIWIFLSILLNYPAHGKPHYIWFCLSQNNKGVFWSSFPHMLPSISRTYPSCHSPVAFSCPFVLPHSVFHKKKSLTQRVDGFAVKGTQRHSKLQLLVVPHIFVP